MQREESVHRALLLRRGQEVIPDMDSRHKGNFCVGYGHKPWYLCTISAKSARTEQGLYFTHQYLLYVLEHSPIQLDPFVKTVQ